MEKRINIKILLLSLLFLFSAIFLYFLLHGTKNLLIFNTFGLPLFDGINIDNKFLNGYLIDILWFNAFCIFYLNFRSILLYIVFTLIAVFLEFFQLFIPSLGTFDVSDILIYLISGTIFILITLFAILKTKSNK